jgi:hypothetical protein
MTYTPGIIARGRTVVVVRYKEVEYIDGLPTKPEETRFDATASVQPVTGQELLQVPEGDRHREHIYLFTKDDIRLDDTIIYAEREFEVQRVDDWEDQGLALAHRRCRAVLKDVNQRES